MSISPRTFIVCGALAIAALVGACSTSGDLDDSADTTITETSDTSGSDTTTTGPDTTTTTGSDGMPDRDMLLDEMARGFLEEDDVPVSSQEEADCVANDFADVIGDDFDRFLEDDLDDFELDEDQAMDFARSFRACGVDIEGFFADSMMEGGATEDQAACVIDEFGIDNLEKVLAFGMLDRDASEFEEKLNDAVEHCR